MTTLGFRERHHVADGAHSTENRRKALHSERYPAMRGRAVLQGFEEKSDRKSTRLNSSHQIISYAVFCLKKKTSKHHRGKPARLLQPIPPRTTRHASSAFTSRRHPLR